MIAGKLGKFVCAWTLLAAFAVAQGRETGKQQKGAASAGTQNSSSTSDAKPDRAQAYYHYSLGHLYEERGALFNRPDLLSQAIEELKLAINYDPASSFLSMELAMKPIPDRLRQVHLSCSA